MRAEILLGHQRLNQIDFFSSKCLNPSLKWPKSQTCLQLFNQLFFLCIRRTFQFKILKALYGSVDNKHKYQLQCFLFLSVALLILLSPPSCDAKPRIQLPDHCRLAANPQPHCHRQPAKQYRQPDARHDGPVPASAVLSGNCNKMDEMKVNTAGVTQ